MSSNIDPKMLEKLLIQIRAAIPVVRAGIEIFAQDATRYAELEDAYQNMYPIIDVASMLELRFLHYIGTSVTNMIEAIAAESHLIDGARITYLLQVVDLIEPCLTGMQGDDSNEEEIVTQAVQFYRRFKNLPENEDQEAIIRVIQNSSLVKETPDEIRVDTSINNTDNDNFSQFDDSEIDFAEELLEGFLLEAEDYLDTIGTLLPEITEDTQQK